MNEPSNVVWQNPVLYLMEVIDYFEELAIMADDGVELVF
jgi:hypothetical protein